MTGVLLAEVVRSGFVESRHYGSLVALGPAGDRLLAAGDPDAPTYPRSSMKPIQASVLVAHGVVERFELDARHVALMAASHFGEPMHTALARDILHRAALTDDDLQCGTDGGPHDPATIRALHAAGEQPGRIHHNCSGKHSGMLAACVASDWPTATYRDPQHPLQRDIRALVEDFAGETVAATGVDGCGAPVYAYSLPGLARSYSRAVTAPEGAPERRVADAMRAHPEYTSGTGTDVVKLMHAVPGLLVKEGAEGVYAAALPDGRAIAFKITDGSARARPVVLVAALRALGVDAPGLEEFATLPVFGRQERVGEIRPAAGVFAPPRS